MLNRTIYYDEQEWLRNQQRKLNEEEKALKNEFGIARVYPADLFYQTHKITQKDFLETLRTSSADEVAKQIDKLFEDPVVGGRRGVKSLKQANERQNQIIEKRQKMQKFVRKFTSEGMSHREI